MVDSLSFQRDRSEARSNWVEAFTEILPRPGLPEPPAASPSGKEESTQSASGGSNRIRNIRDRKEAAEAAAAGDLPDGGAPSAQNQSYMKRQAGRVTQRNDAHQANMAGNM